MEDSEARITAAAGAIEKRGGKRHGCAVTTIILAAIIIICLAMIMTVYSVFMGKEIKEETPPSLSEPSIKIPEDGSPETGTEEKGLTKNFETSP